MGLFSRKNKTSDENSVNTLEVKKTPVKRIPYEIKKHEAIFDQPIQAYRFTTIRGRLVFLNITRNAIFLDDGSLLYDGANKDKLEDISKIDSDTIAIVSMSGLTTYHVNEDFTFKVLYKKELEWADKVKYLKDGMIAVIQSSFEEKMSIIQNVSGLFLTKNVYSDQVLNAYLLPNGSLAFFAFTTGYVIADDRDGIYNLNPEALRKIKLNRNHNLLLSSDHYVLGLDERYDTYMHYLVQDGNLVCLGENAFLGNDSLAQVEYLKDDTFVFSLRNRDEDFSKILIRKITEDGNEDCVLAGFENYPSEHGVYLCKSSPESFYVISGKGLHHITLKI